MTMAEEPPGQERFLGQLAQGTGLEGGERRIAAPENPPMGNGDQAADSRRQGAVLPQHVGHECEAQCVRRGSVASVQQPISPQTGQRATARLLRVPQRRQFLRREVAIAFQETP